jgi:hypothetical protein
MSDVLNCAQLDVELLPARTVLSTFAQGTGANGTDAFGGLGIGIPIVDKILPGSGNAVGGAGQNANG